MVCQLIFIFEVSAHRPISLAEASPKNGAKEEPQFPPIIVVIHWLTKLSWRGKEKIVQWVSEWLVISIKPGATHLPVASTML